MNEQIFAQTRLGGLDVPYRHTVVMLGLSEFRQGASKSLPAAPEPGVHLECSWFQKPYYKVVSSSLTGHTTQGNMIADQRARRIFLHVIATPSFFSPARRPSARPADGSGGLMASTSSGLPPPSPLHIRVMIVSTTMLEPAVKLVFSAAINSATRLSKRHRFSPIVLIGASQT